MTVLIYGLNGTGKTTLAVTWPRPILILGAEDGTASVQDEEDVYLVRLRKAHEFRQLISLVGRTGDYRTLILDSASSLESQCLAEVLGLEELPTQKSWGMASENDYGAASVQVKEIMRDMTRLAEEGHCNALVLGQERASGKGSGTSDNLTEGRLGVGLGKSAALWANAEFDYIFRMTIREETEEVTETYKSAGRVKRRIARRPTGNMEHVAVTRKNLDCVTKFRIPMGRYVPDVIPSPNYEKIRSVIDGTYADTYENTVNG